MLDWATWGFVAYAVMFFLQQYWWIYIDFYHPLKLPPYFHRSRGKQRGVNYRRADRVDANP